MSGDIHVVPANSGWTVREEGTARTSHYESRQEAVRAGRELASMNHSEHIVHGRDGRIQQRDSYGRDPFPSRGR